MGKCRYLVNYLTNLYLYMVNYLTNCYRLPCGSRREHFDNFQGFPLTPPSIEVLDGRELDSSDVLGHTHYPL